MQEAAELFEDAMAWLEEHYGDFRFFLERDVVWTVQTRILSLISKRNLPNRIFNDPPITPGRRADLVILDRNGIVQVAVEFKYEPSHARKDIPATKFPVVFWDKDGVGEDVRRIREFVDTAQADVAYVVFIDEGGYFRKRSPHPGSEWKDWTTGCGLSYRPSVLWSKVKKSSITGSLTACDFLDPQAP